MTRLDLFLLVHKGLRAEIFETARAIARTDFAAPAQCRAAAARLERCFGFLEEHARHEEQVIFAELAGFAAVLAAELGNEHSRLDGLLLECSRVLARLEAASESERVALGRRLHGLFGGFVAEYLRHMEREECEVNRMLWAHRSDAELGALHARILAAIEPARLNEWLELILPELNPSERAALLAGAGEPA